VFQGVCRGHKDEAGTARFDPNRFVETGYDFVNERVYAPER
jgi:hypothetical protein